MSKDSKIRVGISVGDLNGVGPEVVLKTFEKSGIQDFCTPILFASTKVISYQKKTLNSNIAIHGVDSVKDAIPGRFNVVNVWKESVNIEFGKSTELGGKYAFLSLEAATNALINGDVDVLVTAPINKHNIQSEEFKFPGHTEYLAEKLGGESLMLMVANDYRIGVATGHIPISKVSESLTSDLINNKLSLIIETLKKDFGINKPKIAVLSLNPHSGDNGLIGEEELNVINPVIKENFEKGNMVFGPYAADGFFGQDNHRGFDAILGMYHDQALTPFKTISFNTGVNYTAGLSKIRTSPDHGTAYEIAGKGIADATSFEEAVFTAIDIYNKRSEYEELNSNVLRVKSDNKGEF
jgi:4-hydroxythreonine-4-phosphate dehydrogenase